MKGPKIPPKAPKEPIQDASDSVIFLLKGLFPISSFSSLGIIGEDQVREIPDKIPAKLALKKKIIIC